MSKLIDIFVEWAHQQRRWPLLFLLAVPAIVKFSEEYFQLSLREALAHWSVLIASGALFVVLGGLYYLVGPKDPVERIWIGGSFAMLGAIAAIAGAFQLRPPPLSSNRLVVAIVRLTAVAATARDDADNLAYSLEQALREKQKGGLPLDVKHLTSEITGPDERTRRAAAVSVAMSQEGAAHVVLWGDVQKDEGQLYVELRLTVARPLGKELPEERSLRRTSEGPSHIAFKRTLSTEIGKTIGFIYGLTLYNRGHWQEAAAIFEQLDSPPNHLYHAMCLLAQYREQFLLTLDTKSGLKALQSAEEELLVAYRSLLDQNDLDLASLSLIKLGDALRWQNQWDSALEQYDEALKLAVKGRNPTREAEARVARATTKLLGTHDFEGAMANIEQAISFYQKANETSALFNALNRKAEIQEGQGDLNGAIQTLGSALSIPLQPDDRGLLFYGYLDRASVQEKKSWSHFNEKDFVKAHDVANGAKADYQRALAVAESRGWNGLADQTRSFMKDLETRRALLDTMAKSAERLKQASPTSDPAAPPTLPSERRPR